ncbi:hypothetical protein AOLI_G00116560 [Acnodon oligacanthus]
MGQHGEAHGSGTELNKTQAPLKTNWPTSVRLLRDSSASLTASGRVIRGAGAGLLSCAPIGCPRRSAPAHWPAGLSIGCAPGCRDRARADSAQRVKAQTAWGLSGTVRLRRSTLSADANHSKCQKEAFSLSLCAFPTVCAAVEQRGGTAGMLRGLRPCEFAVLPFGLEHAPERLTLADAAR